MPNPKYDPSAPTDPLRRWPAVIVPVLVTAVLEEADELAAEDRNERPSNWSVSQCLFFADIADLSGWLTGYEWADRTDIESARDLLDAYNATHPEHWAGRNHDLILMGAELLRDYADVLVDEEVSPLGDQDADA